MEQTTMKPNQEFISKWHKIYFYDEFFTCEDKFNFRKRYTKIHYKDITDIKTELFTINYLSTFYYKIFVKNEKK